MESEQWPPEWQRGLFETVVLSVIAADGEPTYGYRIVQDLEASGFGRIKGGTLYPILARLETSGLIASRWGEGDGGPGRKFVSITSAGRAHLKQMLVAWKLFSDTVGDLVAAAEGAME